jgi:hypothetical protein
VGALYGCGGLYGGFVGGDTDRSRQITYVRADGVGHLPRRADGVVIGTLLDEAVGVGGHRENTLGQGPLQRGVGAAGPIHVARRIPADVERGASRLKARGFMRSPPVPELLVSAFRMAGAADADRRPPDGGMSMGVHHHDLLCANNDRRWCAVQSPNRLREDIVPHQTTIQRIVHMKTMHNTHE